MYGPNIFSLPSLITQIILIRDFTMAFDRLSTTWSQQNWLSTNIVKQYMNDFGLCDAWYSHHLTLREYTFFSPVHHSY